MIFYFNHFFLKTIFKKNYKEKQSILCFFNYYFYSIHFNILQNFFITFKKKKKKNIKINFLFRTFFSNWTI